MASDPQDNPADAPPSAPSPRLVFVIKKPARDKDPDPDISPDSAAPSTSSGKAPEGPASAPALSPAVSRRSSRPRRPKLPGGADPPRPDPPAGAARPPRPTPSASAAAASSATGAGSDSEAECGLELVLDDEDDADSRSDAPSSSAATPPRGVFALLAERFPESPGSQPPPPPPLSSLLVPYDEKARLHRERKREKRRALAGRLDDPVAPNAAHLSTKPRKRPFTNLSPRVIFQVPLSADGTPKLPILIGGMSIESLGRICPLDKYHAKHYIWPVGFKSTRPYASLADVRQRCTYISEIGMGNPPESGPVFTVTCTDDPTNPIVSATASGAWTEVVKRINDKKKELTGKRMFTTVSGPEMFGYAHPTIAKLIQDLPDATLCKKYLRQEFVLQSADDIKKKTQKRAKSEGSIANPDEDGGEAEGGENSEGFISGGEASDSDSSSDSPAAPTPASVPVAASSMTLIAPDEVIDDSPIVSRPP